MCAEFLATFIFVFVVVSCVVFTYEDRATTVNIVLARNSSARVLFPEEAQRPLAAAAAACCWGLLPPLSGAPPPAWIEGASPAGWRGRARRAAAAALAAAPAPAPALAPVPSPGALPRALQGPSPSPTSPPLTLVTVKFDSFGISRWIFIALAVGFMIGVLVFSVGSISGANINPAVTLALALTRKMSTFRAACYIAAQLAGSTLGALIVRSLAPTLFLRAGGGANGVANVLDGDGASRLSTWTVLGGEMLGTGVLVLTVCAAADVGREKNNRYQAALTPLMIGLAVTVAHLVLIPIDGCSVNPARSFGAALVVGAFPDHYLFWAGPMLGAAVAAFVYTNLLVLREKEEAWGEEGEDAPGSLGGGIALLRTRASGGGGGGSGSAGGSGSGSAGGTPSLGAGAPALVPPSPLLGALPAPALPANEEERARFAVKSVSLSQRLETAAGNKGQLALGGRQHVDDVAWAAGNNRGGVKEW